MKLIDFLEEIAQNKDNKDKKANEITELKVKISKADGPDDETSSDFSKSKEKISSFSNTIREQIESFIDNNSSDEDTAGKIPVLFDITFKYDSKLYNMKISSKDKGNVKVISFDKDNNSKVAAASRIKNFDQFYTFLDEQEWLTN